MELLTKCIFFAFVLFYTSSGFGIALRKITQNEDDYLFGAYVFTFIVALVLFGLWMGGRQ